MCVQWKMVNVSSVLCFIRIFSQFQLLQCLAFDKTCFCVMMKTPNSKHQSSSSSLAWLLTMVYFSCWHIDKTWLKYHLSLVAVKGSYWLSQNQSAVLMCAVILPKFYKALAGFYSNARAKESSQIIKICLLDKFLLQ